MNLNLLLFIILAVIAVASAISMLFSRNAVYSALYLIINFGTVAVFYLMLSAPFISLAQVTVYAGAIMVLFLFVIMLLGAEHIGRRTARWWWQPLALFFGLIFIAEAGYIIFFQKGASSIANPAAAFGGPEAIGEALFSQYLLPFEVTSVLLLAAMVGAIVLTKRKL